MEPISNVDRLVLILRQRLLERSMAASADRRRPASGSNKPATALEQARALAAIDSVDDRQIKHALIQGVLAENLGRELVNDAGFQQVVDKVTSTLDGDPEMGRLMARVVSDLKAAARP